MLFLEVDIGSIFLIPFDRELRSQVTLPNVNNFRIKDWNASFLHAASIVVAGLDISAPEPTLTVSVDRACVRGRNE